MNVKIMDETNPNCVRDAIELAYIESRFTLALRMKWGKRTTVIISKVRLRSNKAYCGNHPGACNIGGVDRKGRFLEGADWVEFNDMLNDTLDKLNVNARVESTYVPVLVRDGRERCVSYVQQWNGRRNAEWVREGWYEDYCGKVAPPSDFPEGTPGIYERIGYNVVG